ncbi:hypothetical protein MTR_7g010230 [Medicago truncatula]|uniref:Uncharacterized protein n=1 Tax=Medicago truncatula TaxID=3880 RepID=G7L0W6_MEDTR|nr:hypothetical protein MTR_7g010230 [Medicago truncatula]
MEDSVDDDSGQDDSCWGVQGAVTHPEIAPSQARLTVEFLWNELPKRRCNLLI